MEHPVQVAFCPLLFAHNGGQFDELGRPKFMGEDIRGLCDTAYDCAECHVMQTWLQGLTTKGWVATWECLECISGTRDSPRQLPGYFTAGSLEDEDKPSIPGCMQCGEESSFLQLVLRMGK